MELSEVYISKYSNLIDRIEPMKINGKVSDVIGLVIESIGPNVSLGEICTIINRSGKELCKTEVVGFRDGKVLSIALGEVEKISPNSEIVSTGKSFMVGVGDELLGRVIDGLGNPIDGKGMIEYRYYRDIYREPAVPGLPHPRNLPRRSSLPHPEELCRGENRVLLIWKKSFLRQRSCIYQMSPGQNPRSIELDDL